MIPFTDIGGKRPLPQVTSVIRFCESGIAAVHLSHCCVERCVMFAVSRFAHVCKYP